MAGSVLEVTDLRVTIDGAPVVDDISFALRGSEVLALVGESGCGKSLTALALARLLPEAAALAGGKVRFAGLDLATVPEETLRKLRGDRIAYIFQEPSAALDPLMPVGRQVAEAILVHARAKRRQVRAEVVRRFREVGITEPERRYDQYPFQLSGGMCQRVMIAMALAGSPAVLLADEPTTALDVTIQAQILFLMQRLRRERGAAILLITHDMGVVAEMADRVAVMYAGRIVEEAPVALLFTRQHHPYTNLLLRSIPRLDTAPKSRLATIEGTVPRPGELAGRCRFADRCPLAIARCREASPPLAPVAPGRRAACWRHGDVDALLGRAAA